VRQASLVRTSSFRLTLLYAGLFGASVLVLFGLIYWTTEVYLGRQLDDVVETDLATLEDVFREGGSPALVETIGDRLKLPSNRAAYYLLLSSDGRAAAGNLPVLSPETSWRDLTTDVAEGRKSKKHRLRGKGTVLADGSYLFAGQDTLQLDELRELIARAFGWATGVTLALALAGGAVMSASLLRRVEAINEITEHIVAGDLARRLPTRGTDDEFDRLAVNLNTMLERMERLMEGLRQVSNDIAHDLRTPLTRLRQNLEAARRHAHDIGGLEAAMDRAIAETDGILGTFGALLRIAQIEAGTRRAGFAEVNLSSVVATVIEVYGPAAEEKNQELTADVGENVTIVGDQELLTQMIANLVENAIRHSPIGARIDVGLTTEASTVRFVVADDGPGIPVEAHEKVFQRLFRLETSRTTPGSGLGLSLVAAVVDLHDMTVRLFDNDPGLRVVVEMPHDALERRLTGVMLRRSASSLQNRMIAASSQ
jgi:signal transduction histidine kinase